MYDRDVDQSTPYATMTGHNLERHHATNLVLSTNASSKMVLELERGLDVS